MTARLGGEAGEARGTGILRASLLVLAVLGTVGTALELAALRHWNGVIQLIPWIVLGVAIVALGLLLARPDNRIVRLARALAAVVVAAGVYGMVEHVISNYESGPLDKDYATRWEAMTEAGRIWAALSESVGPSPPVAPAALAQVGLCLLFATLALGSPRRRPA